MIKRKGDKTPEASKKAVDVKIDKAEPVKVKSSSDKKKDFAAIIAAYKKRNPWKYELKKAALEAKLKSL